MISATAIAGVVAGAGIIGTVDPATGTATDVQGRTPLESQLSPLDAQPLVPGSAVVPGTDGASGVGALPPVPQTQSHGS